MTADPVSIVVIGLAALVTLVGGIFGMAVAIKTLFVRQIDPAKEFVTRQELQTVVTDIDRKIDNLKTEVLLKMDRGQDYARTASHETNGTLQNIMLKVEHLLAIKELERENKRCTKLDGPEKKEA